MEKITYKSLSEEERFMADYMVPLCDEGCNVTVGLCDMDYRLLKRAGENLTKFIKSRDFNNK